MNKLVILLLVFLSGCVSQIVIDSTTKPKMVVDAEVPSSLPTTYPSLIPEYICQPRTGIRCNEAPAGWYEPPGSAYAIECPVMNTYGLSVDRSKCLSCPSGSVSDAGSTKKSSSWSADVIISFFVCVLIVFTMTTSSNVDNQESAATLTYNELVSEVQKDLMSPFLHNNNILMTVLRTAVALFSWAVIGHLCTDRGRLQWYRVLSNYVKHFQIAFGLSYANEDLTAEQFLLDANIEPNTL